MKFELTLAVGYILRSWDVILSRFITGKIFSNRTTPVRYNCGRRTNTWL